MRIFTDNFENLTARRETTRRGVYRVWVRAPEGESTPLVARWIDPEAETREREPREANENKDAAREEGEVPLWFGISLRFA
jgi:hypothetical protein